MPFSHDSWRITWQLIHQYHLCLKSFISKASYEKNLDHTWYRGTSGIHWPSPVSACWNRVILLALVVTQDHLRCRLYFYFPKNSFFYQSTNMLTKPSYEAERKRCILNLPLQIRIRTNNFLQLFSVSFFQVDAWNYWNVVYVSRTKEWMVSTPGNLGGVAIWSPAPPWTLGSTTGKLGVVDLLLWLFPCTAAFLIFCGPPVAGPSLTSLDDSFEVKGLWDTSPEVFELTPRLGKNWHHDGMKLFLYRNYIQVLKKFWPENVSNLMLQLTANWRDNVAPKKLPYTSKVAQSLKTW